MESNMKIIVTEPPKYGGLLERVCNQCEVEILICETKAGATIVLDERPGPYRLEDEGKGRIRAVHRSVTNGYSFHFGPDGSCVKPEDE
jgi:hypothetical protein